MTSLLLWSARHMDTIGIEEALDLEGTDVNEVDDSGDSALMMYCKFKSMPELYENNEQNFIPSILFAHGIDINIQNDEGKTALILAIENLNIQSTVVDIIHHGADVNLSDYSDKTPLMYALERGFEFIIPLLLSKNADVNARDSTGSHILHYACVCSGYDTVIQLVEHGAKVNVHDISGITPLMVASLSGDIQTVKYLISKGSIISKRDFKRWDASIWAAWGRNEEIVEYLVKRPLVHWGLFRTIPFMLLWRKRATERLYHPRNLQKFLPIDVDDTGQIRIHGCV